MYIAFAARSALGSPMPKRKTAMTKATVRLMEGTFMDKMSARDSALLQRERAFEKGSILRLRLRKCESTGFGMIEATEPEAELFAVAEQVDLAEKAFHDALACRNEAQIAYLREPSIMTRDGLEAAKTAEAVALEILNAEVRWLASTRATTVTGLKLKASYASTEGNLADSIVEDIMRL
jgi:hypothetical protein